MLHQYFTISNVLHDRNSGWILLNCVPEGIHVEQLERGLLQHVPSVASVHHLHVWTLTGTEYMQTKSQMTQVVSGHRQITTPRCPGYRGVATPRCPGNRGVETILVSGTSGTGHCIAHFFLQKN